MTALPLSGRVALVTGATRRIGIGYASARRLAAAGASVFLHQYEKSFGVLPDDPDGVADGVRAALADPAATIGRTSADLTATGAPERLDDTVVTTMGRLDILVCNHALSGQDGPLGTLDESMLDAHWRSTPGPRSCWRKRSRTATTTVRAAG